MSNEFPGKDEDVPFETTLEKYLQSETMREKLYLKLKNAGANSEAGKSFVKTISLLGLNKMVKGADRKVTIQGILKYFEPEECFVRFRLVSRSWLNAVETARISNHPREFLFNLQHRQLGTQGYLNFLRKYLRIFREVKFSLTRNFVYNWNILIPIIYENMHNLKSISITYENFFDTHGHTSLQVPVPYNDFVSQFVQKNQNTLEFIKTPEFNIYNLCLPLVHFMSFTLKRPSIDIFTNNFHVLLQNMEKLTFIELILENDIEVFSKKILESNIHPYFITADVRYWGHLPLKIVTGVDWIIKCDKFSEHVEYLDICGIPYQAPNEQGWENYKEIFSSYPNLKGIVLNTHTKTQFLTLDLGEYCTPEQQVLWKERVEYLTKVLKIDVMHRSEIVKNEELERQLAKENNCRCVIRLY